MSERPLTLFSSRSFTVALGTVILVTVWVAVGPWLLTWDYVAIDWNAIDQPPSSDHLLGTDTSGRDLLARILAGGRVSLTVALLATSVSFCIGLPWGAISGYFGGRVDQIMMRFVDGLYCIPFVLVVILFVVLLGRNTYLLFIALGAVSWLDIARIVRGQTLTVKNEDFIDAARALGASGLWIVARHILPNVIAIAFVYATLTIPGVIIAESFISFLGLGIQEPQTSWGVLIADGTREMHSSPWQLLFPSLVLVITLVALNAVGDRMRDYVSLRL